MPDRYPHGPDHNVFQAARSTLWQQRDRLGFLVEMARTYGDLCHFHTGLRDIYLFNHPDYIRTVLVEQADKFHRTPVFKRALGQFLGNGIFVLDGEAHRNERRLVQPAFHHQRIEAYGAVMVEHTQRLIARWERGREYDAALEMMDLTAGIVAKTLFDADIAADVGTLAHSMDVLQNGASRKFGFRLRVPDWFPTAEKRREQAAIDALDRLIYRIIDERRASGQDTGDLLSMLLRARIDADDPEDLQQVRDETISLFLAGHETTANALTWTWYLLAQHPEAEAQLRRELTDVLQGRLPTVQDIPRLVYCAMVIREALRLYPPAWLIARVAIADVTIGDYRLKTGNVAVICPYVTHRHPRYFPDPEQFRPERFAPGYEQSIPRYAFFPFSGGPHNCPGQAFAMMEAVLILASIAQRFRLVLVPGQSIEMDPLVTMRVKHGVRMTVQET